jgi:hypothetical protein
LNSFNNYSRPDCCRVDLVRTILDYLDSHPQAADSVEGVARWWLGSCAGQFTLTEVERALTQLADCKRLRQETLADATTLYSKNVSNASEGASPCQRF